MSLLGWCIVSTICAHTPTALGIVFYNLGLSRAAISGSILGHEFSLRNRPSAPPKDYVAIDVVACEVHL